MLSDVKILYQKQDTEYQAGGTFRPVIVTSFKVGDDGPFSVQLPVEGFNAADNLKKIEALADSVRATRAHSDLK